MHLQPANFSKEQGEMFFGSLSYLKTFVRRYLLKLSAALWVAVKFDFLLEEIFGNRFRYSQKFLLLKNQISLRNKCLYLSQICSSPPSLLLRSFGGHLIF